MKDSVKHIRLIALCTLIVLASSCKKDKNIDDPNYLGSRITFFTTKVEGQSISLYIDADPADRADVWVDLNNNKKRDAGESITKFGIGDPSSEIELTISTQMVTIYGKVTKLEFSRSQLASMDLTHNTALTHLYCSNNQLTSLDLTRNTALEVLYCSNNQLTSLDLSKNTVLRILHCNNNQLFSLNLAQNTELTHIFCHNNQFTSLDLTRNIELIRLDCSRNQLSSLNLSKNTQLNYLESYHNRINQTNMNSLLSGLADRRTIGLASAYIYKPSAGNSTEGNWQPTTQLINNVRSQKNWIVHVN